MAFSDDAKAEKELLSEQLKRVDDELSAIDRQNAALQEQRRALVNAIKSLNEAANHVGALERLNPPGPAKTQPPQAKNVPTVPGARPIGED
jgi:prefoldin subunit 5